MVQDGGGWCSPCVAMQWQRLETRALCVSTSTCGHTRQFEVTATFEMTATLSDTRSESALEG